MKKFKLLVLTALVFQMAFSSLLLASRIQEFDVQYSKSNCYRGSYKPDSPIQCDRCQKRLTRKVHLVKRSDYETEFKVGSTCVKRMLNPNQLVINSEICDTEEDTGQIHFSAVQQFEATETWNIKGYILPIIICSLKIVSLIWTLNSPNN